MKRLVCDYLIVGSGASPMAFLDTLLTELPDKKVVLVDKKVRPGGHWVDDYDFVHLHQPSIVYGIASQQLEGNWAKLLFTKGMLPWVHRASKQELLDHFQKFVDSKCESGQVEYFPECVYDFSQTMDENTKVVTFESIDGKETYEVEVREKLVNGVQGECIIPSLNPPAFPVDENIKLMTPNQVYDLVDPDKSEEGFLSKLMLAALCPGKTEIPDKANRHFVVMGAGKTAMDTVVFLQEKLGVAPSDISWVISNDVWMLSRENSQGPFGYVKALLDHNGDKDKAVLALEAEGQFVRLDPDVTPTRFRFPTVGKEEIKVMRKVDHKIRRGRVSAIKLDQNTGDIVVEFEKDDWVIPKSSNKEHIFVHCTSPGPFNDKASDGVIFRSERDLTLDLLFAPPISISMSCLAKLESARQKGTLDTEFGAELLGIDGGASANKVLGELIQSVRLASRDVSVNVEFLDELKSSITQAMFVALVDKDPMVGVEWLKSNRLSMLSIPGFKAGIVEDLELIVEKGKTLGSDPEKLEMIRKVAVKLEPLRGK